MFPATPVNTAPTMVMTSDPLKLYLEEITKTRTLSGKCVKLQEYIDSLKEQKTKIKDLDLPIYNQFLDHAISTLDAEHDKVIAKIKDILNQTGITNVKELPAEMIKMFQNPSLAPTNAELQASQRLMQQGLSQQFSPHQQAELQRYQQLQSNTQQALQRQQEY